MTTLSRPVCPVCQAPHRIVETVDGAFWTDDCNCLTPVAWKRFWSQFDRIPMRDLISEEDLNLPPLVDEDYEGPKP
jgi:hypothetical protein